MPGNIRRTIDARSTMLLLYLSRLPRFVPFVIVIAVLLAAAFAHGPVAALGLAILIGLVGWLSYLSWPALTGSGRAVRLLVLGLLVLAAVLRLR